MDKETLKRLTVPVFFLMLFLIPTLFWDAVILEFGSELLRRSIWIGRYVIGICLWLTLAWCVIRIVDVVVWPVLVERRSDSGYARKLIGPEAGPGSSARSLATRRRAVATSLSR